MRKVRCDRSLDTDPIDFPGSVANAHRAMHCLDQVDYPNHACQTGVQSQITSQSNNYNKKPDRNAGLDLGVRSVK
jgi:hypothetical protein